MEEKQVYEITEAPPIAPSYPVLGVQVNDDHAVLVISFGPGTWMCQAVTGEQMNHICQQWLSRHATRETS